MRIRIARQKLIICLILMVSISGLTPIMAEASILDEGEYYTLTVLHTNDWHGHVDQIPQYATLIQQVRSEASNVVVLDAGDIFLRGEFENLQGQTEMDLLNALGYDAWVYGNNDFRIGPSGGSISQGNAQIQALAKQAKMPTLCANVMMKNTNQYMKETAPYTTVERSGVKVGVIGVTSLKPQDRKWQEVSDKTFIRGDKGVEKVLPELVGKSDLNIVLSHAGLVTDVTIANMTGVSAVIGGDDHFTIKEPIYTNYNGQKNTPIVQAGGENEHYLGRLDLVFKEKDDQLVLVDHHGLLYDLSSVEKDAKVQGIIDQYRRAQKAAA